MENTLVIFIMIEMAREKGLIKEYLPLREVYEQGKKLVGEFLYNEYDFPNEEFEDNVNRFLENKLWIDIDEAQPHQGQPIYYQGSHGAVEATYIAENVVRTKDKVGIDLFQYWKPINRDLKENY